MPHPDFDRLATEAVTRIWGQLTANAANLHDLFERMTESFYTKVVQPGDTVVDGGAHTGRHAMPLARLVGAEGVVLAFEPLPVAADTLQNLMTTIGLDRRIQLRREALSREPGSRPFYVVHNMPEFSGLKSRDYGDFVPEQSEILVQVTTIDAALGSGGRWPAQVSFLKLDLEGGEFRALQGAEQTLRRYGPCCVFENGLGSSADDYDPREFFEFFRRLDYGLYDILGHRVDERLWAVPGPWQFVAIPDSRAGSLLRCLWTSTLEELLMTPWIPAGQTGPPPSTFSPQPDDSVTEVLGCLDQSDLSLRVRGWAGDLRAGRVRSIIVSVDGKPVATAATGKPRHDVVGATAVAGFADCGFDLALPVAPLGKIEVYAETSSGRLKKIGATGPAHSPASRD
jgi:FkbM family methyltransferase